MKKAAQKSCPGGMQLLHPLPDSFFVTLDSYRRNFLSDDLLIRSLPAQEVPGSWTPIQVP